MIHNMVAWCLEIVSKQVTVANSITKAKYVAFEATQKMLNHTVRS